MKPKITGKKKKGSAAGASSGKGHAPGAGEKRRRETASAADDDDMFMPVPSFENDGKELDLGGAGPAWKTYDWQGEKSAREKKREGGAGAGNARADADAKRAEKRSTNEPVVNRKKPPRPEKKVKVDMRFGSEADKKKLADERFQRAQGGERGRSTPRSPPPPPSTTAPAKTSPESPGKFSAAGAAPRRSARAPRRSVV
jgi:hypothetical protein